MLDDCGGIGGVVLHVVAVAHLARPAVAAPVVGDDPKTFSDKLEHLRVPVIGTQRPAMVKHDRPRVPGALVLEVNLRSVIGGYRGYRGHRILSFRQAQPLIWQARILTMFRKGLSRPAVATHTHRRTTW